MKVGPDVLHTPAGTPRVEPLGSHYHTPIGNWTTPAGLGVGGDTSEGDFKHLVVCHLSLVFGLDAFVSCAWECGYLVCQYFSMQ